MRIARCDLLEISYLCGRINNRDHRTFFMEGVVICSKFPTFVVESTTNGREWYYEMML